MINAHLFIKCIFEGKERKNVFFSQTSSYFQIIKQSLFLLEIENFKFFVQWKVD